MLGIKSAWPPLSSELVGIRAEKSKSNSVKKAERRKKAEKADLVMHCNCNMQLQYAICNIAYMQYIYAIYICNCNMQYCNMQLQYAIAICN